MTEHVHVSALSAWIVFVFVVVIGTLWRGIAAKNSDKPFGKAMHILY